MTSWREKDPTKRSFAQSDSLLLFVEDHYIGQENNSSHYGPRRVENHDVAHIAVL